MLSGNVVIFCLTLRMIYLACFHHSVLSSIDLVYFLKHLIIIILNSTQSALTIQGAKIGF